MSGYTVKMAFVLVLLSVSVQTLLSLHNTVVLKGMSTAYLKGGGYGLTIKVNMQFNTEFLSREPSSSDNTNTVSSLSSSRR